MQLTDFLDIYPQFKDLGNAFITQLVNRANKLSFYSKLDIETQEYLRALWIAHYCTLEVEQRQIDGGGFRSIMQGEDFDITNNLSKSIGKDLNSFSLTSYGLQYRKEMRTYCMMTSTPNN